MRKWFIPSWNGDLRLEANEDTTLLSIVKPTPAEIEILGKMKTSFIEKGWIDEKDWKNPSIWHKRTIIIKAPIAEVGPVASKIMRPGEAVLTAITLENGQMVTHSGSESEELKEIVKKNEKTSKAAVTVKRSTPSCPQCFEGAVEPATEVLLTFLNSEQHESWRKDRTMLVEGGYTGTQYLLAHRESRTAALIGRICYDLDAETVVHFHDRSVPPEEEVLAAKLVLEHREDWLRNEATMLSLSGNMASFGEPTILRKPVIFKNPFGDIYDGVESAQMSVGFGLGQLLAKTLS